MGILVLWINSYWKQQTVFNKTGKMSFDLLKTVTSSSKFCRNITHLNESQALITVMSELFFLWRFSLGHVIIITIISNRISRICIKCHYWPKKACKKFNWKISMQIWTTKCQMWELFQFGKHDRQYWNEKVYGKSLLSLNNVLYPSLDCILSLQCWSVYGTLTVSVILNLLSHTGWRISFSVKKFS